MTNFSHFNRIATAAVGALALSSVFVSAAVGPATTRQAANAPTYAAVTIADEAKV